MTSTASAPVLRRTPLRRRGRRGSIYAPLDALLRQVVLLRDGYRCQRCNNGKRPGRGGALQAAHIKPKGHYPALRYVLENVVCLCASCHCYGPGAWHKDPTAAAAWAVGHFGAEYLERLETLAQYRKQGRQRFEPVLTKLYLEQSLAHYAGVSQCSS